MMNKNVALMVAIAVGTALAQSPDVQFARLSRKKRWTAT